MIGDRSSTKVNLHGEMRELISREAKDLGISISRLLRDYCFEHIKLKEESRLAKEGKIKEGSILHTFISNMEARIAISIESNQNEIIALRNDVQIIAVIIDNYIKLYLNHTKEVPLLEREQRIKSSLVRYNNFLNAIKSNPRNEGGNIISEIRGFIYNKSETEK
ncbi:hypothetical protein NF27_DT00200 [Candidatus Jidaibacter acanthamoeba]|uniref:Uncharacterized protein n=1 Tax=Candidatus Jidaibacter acanthamoebae TaxID=86105 RepID=A0A0C1MZ25_9RICK|nr:hypothetical protein [Candidatus Jidaibacter acanthamoeba]KIE05246.1 hypothetical protein NF27_DT00200 [Candidatus Jidaibacter acanthamoeba]